MPVEDLLSDRFVFVQHPQKSLEVHTTPRRERLSYSLNQANKPTIKMNCNFVLTQPMVNWSIQLCPKLSGMVFQTLSQSTELWDRLPRPITLILPSWQFDQVEIRTRFSWSESRCSNHSVGLLKVISFFWFALSTLTDKRAHRSRIRTASNHAVIIKLRFKIWTTVS